MVAPEVLLQILLQSQVFLDYISQFYRCIHDLLHEIRVIILLLRIQSFNICANQGCFLINQTVPNKLVSKITLNCLSTLIEIIKEFQSSSLISPALSVLTNKNNVDHYGMIAVAISSEDISLTI